MKPALLSTEELSLGRGDRVLISGLSLDVGAGRSLYVRGRNGAGKTSLLEVLAGLRPPISGQVRRPVPLHWLGHKNALNADMSVLDNLRFWSAMQGASGPDLDLKLASALDRLGLTRLRFRPTRTLSAGQKRRAALARLLVLPRPLWLLDEPLSALDVAGLERFAEIVNEHLVAGGGLVVTSHQPLPIDSTRVTELELAR
jgi:heme exporter protein A